MANSDRPRISIIIPQRGRGESLDLCARSLELSAAACGMLRSEYEVVVVNDGIEPHCPEGCILVTCPDLAPEIDGVRPFWKTKLLNLGRDRSWGPCVAFLDADIVVGPHWFDTFGAFVKNPRLTRLCWRVRMAPRDFVERAKEDFRAAHAAAFAVYERCSMHFEGYGTPECRGVKGEPVFGNSQFAMLRKCMKRLGIRFDESYVGRGCEDLAAIREIWRKAGDQYRSKIWTDGDHALLHIRHPFSPGFEPDDRWEKENVKRYQET